MLKTHIILSLASILTFASCNEKKEKHDIIVPAPKVETKKGTQQMKEVRQERNVKWLGKDYSVSVMRTADKSLPLIKDENGQEYYDNAIDVKVLRADGTKAFNKKFTKQDFTPMPATAISQKTECYWASYWTKWKTATLSLQ